MSIDLKFSKLPFLKKHWLHYVYYLFLVWAIYYGFVWSIWNRCTGYLSSYLCACRESGWNQWNIWWNILFKGNDLLIQQQCCVDPLPHSDAFLHSANRADPDQAALIRASCLIRIYSVFLWNMIRYDPTLVNLASIFVVLCTNVKIYLCNYS